MMLYATPSLNDRYGRKIGYLKLMGARVSDGLGRYAAYRNIRWDEVRRLVFICHGNICRSAYAEARARSLSMSATSAGLGARKNGPANEIAIRVAGQRGIDLNRHRTTPVSDLVMRAGDLAFCMEAVQARVFKSTMVTSASYQTTLLGLWAGEVRQYLQDPYGLEDGYWQTCFDLIDSAIENIGTRLGAVRATEVTPGTL